MNILRKIGAGVLILLLVFFLTDYFRVRSDYGIISNNLWYNKTLFEDMTLEVRPSMFQPEGEPTDYYEITKILKENKSSPYLLRKDIILYGDDKIKDQIDKTGGVCIVSGKVAQNNYGMLKMEVTRVLRPEGSIRSID